MAACSVTGCRMPARANGMCMRHYDALRRHGDVHASIRRRFAGKSAEERFWLNTKRGRGCWEWTGGKISTGYGLIHVEGVGILAHRFSYALKHGPIPAGLSVLHRCDNCVCVKPAHLFTGTQLDNVTDMHAKGRDRKRGLPGTTNHQAKIDEATVRAIRGSAARQVDLAARYGISQSAVSAIRNRLIWAHIE